MGDFIVFGADVLDNPSVSTNSSAGNEGQGTATITGGTQPFEDDDIVVISAVNLTADGEIAPGSAISDITVFDTLADFQAGIVKFNYAPQNPGQTATVQSDVSGLGDGYVRFNANVIQPQDGGPSFNQLFVAPGTNLAASAQQPGGLTLDRNQDFDFNGDGDFDDPLEDGNNQFLVGDYVSPVPCFTAGTAILTPEGNRPVEDLRPGDLVVTRDNGVQPLRWVGQRRVRASGEFAPIQFEIGALSNAKPLLVSPNHRMLITGPSAQYLFSEREVLVAAKFLVNDTDIRRAPGGWVTYVHLLFDAHEIVWAEGCGSESLLPSCAIQGAERMDAASLREVELLYPELKMTEQPVQAARRCLTHHEASLLNTGTMH